MSALQCPSCGKKITCQRDSSCWCHHYPHSLSPSEGDQCLCSTCLEKALAEKINSANYQHSEEEVAKIKQLGEPAVPTEGIDYYIENGLLVMTKWYLLRRGYCCENGCRHCPYCEKV